MEDLWNPKGPPGFLTTVMRAQSQAFPGSDPFFLIFFWGGGGALCNNHFIIGPRISWTDNPLGSSMRLWKCLGHVMDTWGLSPKFCLLTIEAIPNAMGVGHWWVTDSPFSRELSWAANGWRTDVTWSKLVTCFNLVPWGLWSTNFIRIVPRFDDHTTPTQVYWGINKKIRYI